MLLDEALSIIPRCHPPKLTDHSVLQIIDTDEFYYPSPVNLIHKDENSRFILFSAPGAVGKTALAKYIAREYGGLYWNIAQKPVLGTSFAGEIAHATGIRNGGMQDKLYADLNAGKALFILDAFDEAALISRREGVKDFLVEIGEILSEAAAPSVILTARSGMAEFIMTVCHEYGFGITQYSIDYFETLEAQNFIEKYFQFKHRSLNGNQKKSVKEYLDDIRRRIGNEDNIRPFLGYAQVLRILSRQIERAFDPQLTSAALTLPHCEKGKLIYNIIQELIDREQSKLEEFKNSIRGKYIELGKTDIVDSLYCKQEQLIRLQFYSLLGTEISLDDYSPCAELLPDDKVAYMALLKDWLPQHVFLENGSIMPIFSDYILAETLLNPDLEMFAEDYLKNQGTRPKLPTRVFADCYLSLNSDCVKSEHIYFLDLAYSSQITIGNRAFCDIGYDQEEDNENLYLTFFDSEKSENRLSVKILRDGNGPIYLNRAENISVNVEGRVILSSKYVTNIVVRDAFIECDILEFDGADVSFETYGDEEIFIIAHDDVIRAPSTKISIKGTNALSVDFPFQNSELKRSIHELISYQCAPGSGTDGSCDIDSIEQFSYGLKKVLEQFRVDRYSGDPAKFKQKIDARCHTGVKANVLKFLISQQIVYEDGLMYKCSLDRMSELNINRGAYTEFNYEQLGDAYEKYSMWYSEYNGPPVKTTI